MLLLPRLLLSACVLANAMLPIVCAVILLRGSTALHNRMFAAVLRAPMSFFERNPIGRILNRFSRDVMVADEQFSYRALRMLMHLTACLASLLLVVFSIGIGVGSLLCEVLSRRHVEIGLVPLGAIGMSVFSIDLYFASRSLPASEIMGLAAFMAQGAHWRVMLDLALLSLFAGLYSVPMYALIQMRSQPTHRARIVVVCSQ